MTKSPFMTMSPFSLGLIIVLQLTSCAFKIPYNKRPHCDFNLYKDSWKCRKYNLKKPTYKNDCKRDKNKTFECERSI